MHRMYSAAQIEWTIYSLDKYIGLEIMIACDSNNDLY